MKRIILISAVLLSANVCFAGLASGMQDPDNREITEISTEEVSEQDSGNITEEVETIISEEEVDGPVVEVEWPEYQTWEVATLQGKLRMNGLPLSPSLKIFLQKDSIIDISLRAPFVGEVGRLTLTPEKVTVVNKMYKTYSIVNLNPAGISSEKAAEVTGTGIGEYALKRSEGSGKGIMGLGISAVQDLLLGRFFLPGFDVMNVDLDELVDIFYEEENRFNVVPKGPAVIEGVKYGFVTDSNFNPQMLMVLPKGNDEMEVDAVYSYKPGGYDITVDYLDLNRQIRATLDLKNPEWSGEAPNPINLEKYRELSMPEFIKSTFK